MRAPSSPATTKPLSPSQPPQSSRLSQPPRSRFKFHCTEDARRLARRRLPRMVYDFVAGGAGDENSMRSNRAALAAIRLQPRVLVNTENRRLAKTILGEEKGLPFGIAPMGMCNLTWPGADRMLAAAAVRHDIPLCVSAAASTSMEEFQRLAAGRAWFQLYGGASASPEAALDMADRARDVGYSRLVLTVDVPQVGRRRRELRHGFRTPFRPGPRQCLDFALHPGWSLQTLLRGAPRMMNFTAPGAAFVRDAGRGGADWAFLDALRARWRGQLIVKGVLSAADARRIKQAGADAIYVSNHGGRQLDSAPPAITMLAGIRAAVGTEYPLIFDSGVRGGEDVIKALAMGADFVMLGRPMLYAIGADGARGLAALMEILAEEISVALAQLGLRRADDVDGSVLAPRYAGNAKS